MDNNQLQQFAYHIRKAFTIILDHAQIETTHIPELPTDLGLLIEGLDAMKENAQLIAEYYNTLKKNNVPRDDALELTIVYQQELKRIDNE